jgi:uncharacterized damage-inducible protein DinB
MEIAALRPSNSTGAAKDLPLHSPALVVAAQEVLQQGLVLLETSAEKYAIVAPAPFEASIGQHFRHVLEHFQCVLRGTTCGEVNYDARERNPRIETEVPYAIESTLDVIRKLQAWTESTLKERCNTTSSLDYHSDWPSIIASNLGRELAYCIGHTIHHFAIIRLLCSHIGIALPAEFGYAPSTLKHKGSTAAD